MKNTMKRAATAVAALALLGGTALVAAPGAIAAPAPGAFSVPAFAGLKSSITLPKSGSKDVKFSITFTGTPSDNGYTDVNGDGAAVYYRLSSPSDSSWYKPKRVSSVDKTNVFAPSLYSPYSSNAAPGTTSGFYIRVYSTMTPGKYTFRVPVTQYQWASTGTSIVTTRWATKTINVKASTKYSKANTGASAPGWRTGGTAKITLRAPEYQTGAKVKGYYRANGSKKTKYIGKVKLKKSKGYAKGVIKTKKLTKSGKVWFKVGKVKFAAKYTTKKAKVTVYRY